MDRDTRNAVRRKRYADEVALRSREICSDGLGVGGSNSSKRARVSGEGSSGLSDVVAGLDLYDVVIEEASEDCFNNRRAPLVSTVDADLDGMDLHDVEVVVSSTAVLSRARKGKRRVMSGATDGRCTVRQRRRRINLIDDLPLEPWILPDVAACVYCGAKRYYREVPSFCCGEGQVHLCSRELLPEMVDLLIGDTVASKAFRKNIRSYNNHIAFTSVGMRTNQQYCSSRKGVYSLVVQGMVFHNMNSLSESVNCGANLDLYFHEVDELSGRPGQRSFHLDRDLVVRLVRMLECNPYSRFFRSLRQYTPLANYTIVLRSSPNLDQNTFNVPTVSQVGAIWREGDCSEERVVRDIRVYVNEETSHPIKYYYGCYDPLQYPVMFTRGEVGWHNEIPKFPKYTYHTLADVDSYAVSEAAALIAPAVAETAAVLLENEAEVLDDENKRVVGVTLRQYYCYLLQMRPADKSYILHFGRLLQQFGIDMYIKLETQRLDFYRMEQYQQDVRADSYKAVVDSMAIDGVNSGNSVGRRYVLPSSFIGGPRDMRRRYVNAMALVQKYGKPDIFLTMTCNPAWPEITSELLAHEQIYDRPDLVARVFKAKLEELKDDIIKKKLFGPVAAYVYVVEFQKRGLPHVHWLLILKDSHKIVSPDMFDDIVSAELPEESAHPFLRSYVVKHMLHGPCGAANPTNVCMREGQCKNHYPKKFSPTTRVGSNSYPVYRRRDNGDSVIFRRVRLDNRWVVPYNPFLLAKYNCHFNIEVCCDIKLVKYLYKYIYKGHDRVAFQVVGVDSGEVYDEISSFQTGRWVAAPEAFWRLYGYALSEMYPSVIVLPVHLQDQQVVRFGRYETLSDVVEKRSSQRTMLTEFFKMNVVDSRARELNLLYREFPEHFVWNNGAQVWSPRLRKEVVGRLVTVHPTEGERFYERILLNNIRCPSSMENLRTINGHEYATFREAALNLGLLESDSYIVECLEEAVVYGMPCSLRRLFSTILVYCAPTDPVSLWEMFKSELSNDFIVREELSDSAAEKRALESIHFILQSMGKSINDYSLSDVEVVLTEEQKFQCELERESAIVVSDADLLAQDQLNACQKEAFDAVVEALSGNLGGAFFVDGPGGSGKTFLYRALLAHVRARGDIALAVATSGVAASLLPGGRTAHSRFKFPIDIDEKFDSWMSKQSSLARLIKTAKLIVWDEATMANKILMECLDKLLRDVCDSNLDFGGKVVLFGGDFRQTLPIIVSGSRDDMVSASLVSSVLWPSIRKLRLTLNMRARDDPVFTRFLLSIGDGSCPCVVEDIVEIPQDMCIRYIDADKSLGLLIDHVFPTLRYNPEDPYHIIKRAILTPKNDVVDSINERMINKFPGDCVEYVSCDRTDDPNQQSEYEDYLNTISVGGLPPYRLVLKVNCPVMLLRNLDPSAGLCNGTRLIIKHLGPRVIGAEIAIGDYKGQHVFIPRIPLQATDKLRCPIAFKRHQFPLRLCFAMTINKAQGQTLDYVGVFLQQPVFSHGQLYVALSRARSAANVKVLVRPVEKEDCVLPECSTRNVVYPEIFRMGVGKD